MKGQNLKMRIRGRKPTYEERKILKMKGYDTYVWLVTKNTPTFIELMHRDTGEIATIGK